MFKLWYRRHNAHVLQVSTLKVFLHDNASWGFILCVLQVFILILSHQLILTAPQKTGCLTREHLFDRYKLIFSAHLHYLSNDTILHVPLISWCLSVMHSLIDVNGNSIFWYFFGTLWHKKHLLDPSLMVSSLELALS